MYHKVEIPALETKILLYYQGGLNTGFGEKIKVFSILNYNF